MLKVFLDGSGKSSPETCQFRTLASVFADDTVWEDFELKWSEVLGKYHVPYSHMKELLGNHGPFEKWSESQKRDFVLELRACLNHEDRGSFIGCSLTVSMSDYRRLASASSVKPAEAVCVDFCVTHAFGHPAFQRGRAEIFFDKDEQFIHWLERIWSRSKQTASSWASYVSTLTSSEMREVIPIQAADLLAWAANRHYCSDKHDFWKINHPFSLLLMPHYHQLYEEPQLLKHPGFFNWKREVS